MSQRTRPFDIDLVLDRVRREVEPLPKAAMFELADLGFDSLFEQLVACIISIRTRDETTIPAAKRLFQLARTPAEMRSLSDDEIEQAIHSSTFSENKAPQISEIARRIVDELGGELQADYDRLTAFKGVGPKCANLALGVACAQTHISVDVHVHRITNRWGYVQTNSPKQTLRALEAKLPKTHWVEINKLLVPFGKHVCTGRKPRCSTCPVEEMCQQVGVEAHR